MRGWVGVAPGLGADEGMTSLALVCEEVSESVFLTTRYVVSVTILCCMRLDLLRGSAGGCPGSTCICPVWLGRCCSLSHSKTCHMLQWVSGLVLPKPGAARGALTPGRYIAAISEMGGLPPWVRHTAGGQCGYCSRRAVGNLAFLETHLISQAGRTYVDLILL